MRLGNSLILTTAIIAIVCLFSSCKKDETIVFTDNDIPPYEAVPTIEVQNYVNRLFIDVLGREPLNTEMDTEVAFLESEGLSFSSRTILVNKLMSSEVFIEGDSTYKRAYYLRVYENMKARFIEGVSETYLQNAYQVTYGQAVSDSINGNLTGYQLKLNQANRTLDIMKSRIEYEQGLITIDEMARRMMFNQVYDEINMNSFNFVNATFDDLFFRFPTESEFESAYNIIEFNQADVIFGGTAQNKTEYLDILTNDQEFDEGMIRWAYNSLLAREPTATEIYNEIVYFVSTKDFQQVQLSILTTDEYAGFED